MRQAGQRVGAMLGASNGVVKLLGFGVYEGDEVPPEETNSLAAALGIPNPKIKLDNGEVVWGCQCWWGAEEEIKAQLEKYKEKGYTIQEISMYA